MDTNTDTLGSPANRPASTIGSRRGSKFFLPLSNHGMPKTPLPTSPSGRSHRFLRSPRSGRSSSVGSHPTSPMSSVLVSPMPPISPMSPPMSAKSYATFIDSEPSTPAYSPRAGSSQWDGTTLVVLSPVPSARSSPPEPEWEMVSSRKNSTKDVDDGKGLKQERREKHEKHERREKQEKISPRLSPKISSGTSLSSHPVKQVGGRVSEKTRIVEGEREEQKENAPPVTKEDADADADQEADPTGSRDRKSVQTGPTGKLAKIKSMLHRRSSSEKKPERRRRDSYELHRMETVHWTEM